jgi:DNA-directed RNA polymerase subunit K/omega
MDYKKTKASNTTIPRDMQELNEGTGNMYETIMVIAKRSNQINAELKEELNQKLQEFASYTDNLEEIFENREQIEISRYYERLPKSTLIAYEEYKEGRTYFRNPAKEKKYPNR